MSASEFRAVLIVATTIGLLSLAHGDASAQAATSREQEQLRRMRLQLQQSQQETQAAREQARQATLEQKKAADALAAAEERARRAESAVGSARAAASTGARRASEVEAELAALRSERDALQLKLNDVSARLAQSDVALREQGAQLKTRDTALGAAEGRLKALTAQYENAVLRNQALYRVGTELLERYANKGVAESLASQEGFLQFKKIELENLVQDYRDKLDAGRVTPARAP